MLKCADALPANRRSLAGFLASRAINTVERLLAGLNIRSWEIRDIDWRLDSIFQRFRTYLLDEEGKLERALQSITYFLDDEETLRLLVSNKPPEKVSRYDVRSPPPS